MRRLLLLDDDVARTTARIASEKPEWPCRRGCDHCCRSLSTPMRVSRAEYERIVAAIGVVPEVSDPRVCPLLDASGACRIYDARPIACRTYGFYAARDGGRGCSIVEESGVTDGVMLGNHDVIERALDELGDHKSLAEWGA